MKKTILLLALVLGCAMLNGQKIQMDNGKWYKFRLTKEQMREVMIGKKQDDKRELSYLRDLVEMGKWDGSLIPGSENRPVFLFLPFSSVFLFTAILLAPMGGYSQTRHRYIQYL